ncbi:MAG TPA: SCO family protein [Burkholderiales bacterium]|nr:SCO family protein [Burkholderiales bacterium]
MNKLLSAGLLLAVLGLLAGCDTKSKIEAFQSTDITGANFGRDFHLTDHNGKSRSLADFKGKVVVLFFGYIHCPDVCPATLAELAMMMKDLSEDARKVQVLFVTVDPERDTPQLLAKYVPSFYPSFLGLYGDAEATSATAKEFKVVYQKIAGDSPGNYTMDHSAGTYIFDQQGRLRLFVSYGQGPTVFLHDIKILLAQNPA